MTPDQKLLLRILDLLKRKTEEGRIAWSESPREGRALAVVNGQTYVLAGDGCEDGPPSYIITATDESGRRMWGAAYDPETPEEMREPAEIEAAVAGLADTVWGRLEQARLDRMQPSLEALTAV